MTGEHSTHGTEEGMDGTIQEPWMPPGAQHPGPALLGVPSAGENDCANTEATVRNSFPFIHLSLQTLTGLPKRKIPQKLFYSLFKNAMTLSQGTERPKPFKFGTAKKGTDSQISEEERDPAHTHMGLYTLPNFTGGIPGP